MSNVQDNPEWDLEEIVREVEQKFATDRKTITGKQQTTRFAEDFGLFRKTTTRTNMRRIQKTSKTPVYEIWNRNLR